MKQFIKDKLNDTIAKVVFVVMLVLGIMFIATVFGVRLPNNKLKAEVPSEVPSPAPGFGYERVYAYGNYYMVFYNYSGSDIEVIPLW